MKTTTITSNGEILQQAFADRVAVNTATRKDSTLRVCEHLEMFQPERWKSRARWEYKHIPSPTNNQINAKLRKESSIGRKISALLSSGKIEQAVKLIDKHILR